MKEYKFANYFFGDIRHYAMNHTEWLNFAGRNYDKGFEKSLKLFNELANEDQAEQQQALYELRKRIDAEFTIILNKHNKTIALSHLIWGRMYIAACFIMCNEEFWVNTLIPLMEQIEKDNVVRKDMLFIKKWIAEKTFPKSLLAEECRKNPASLQPPSKYNFQTRLLYPYSDKWENGMKGELWYDWERDAICICNGKYKCALARGFAAALLANNKAFFAIDFDYMDIYKAYNRALEDANIPGRYSFQEEHRMLTDWLYTLEQLEPFKQDFSGYLDRYSITIVGQFLRDLFNPYNSKDLPEKMKRKCYFSCNVRDHKPQQLLFATIPDTETAQSAPMVWLKDINQPYSKSRAQVSGFLASVINYAIYYHWEKAWYKIDFTDVEVLHHFIIAWETTTPFIISEKLEDLNLFLPINILDLCKAYMDTIIPMTRVVLERNPTLPMACWEEDKLYAYIYACEFQTRTDFLKSELYANLTSAQQRFLFGYISRFLEFLEKNYAISSYTQFEHLLAIGKDIPNIRVQLHNENAMTRKGEEKKTTAKKSFTKFEYIISDDKKEILKIHKRIELYLSSPAKLRDELRRLQEEGLVSMPLDNPTAILRALQRVWGKRAPKEGSFKTTWGRLRC